MKLQIVTTNRLRPFKMNCLSISRKDESLEFKGEDMTFTFEFPILVAVILSADQVLSDEDVLALSAVTKANVRLQTAKGSWLKRLFS